MNIDDFVSNIADQFEETAAEMITKDTEFRSLDEWDSLLAMAVIGMTDDIYKVKLTGEDIRLSNTVQDLFNVVMSRIP